MNNNLKEFKKANTKKRLKILEISDVHLGHAKTTSAKILKTLREIFKRREEIALLDMIIIAGDFFDHDLSLPFDEVYEIRTFIIHLLEMCKEYGICLRVLEGTPSHDWKQSRLFTHLNDVAKIGADVKFFDKLSIEYIEHLDVQMLYIPDEWKPTTEETWQDVTEKLKQHQLEAVDFVVMHGTFPHQMPENVRDKLDTHNSLNYIGITKYFVFVGHIHSFSQYECILSAGSPERLAHGEEGPKGYIMVEVDRVNGQHKIQFIENKEATVYKTINCNGLTTEDSLKKLRKEIPKRDEPMYIRIACRSGDPVLSALPALSVEYPTVHWQTKNTEAKAVKVYAAAEPASKYVGVTITPDNIEDLLLGRILVKNPGVYNRCQRLLSENLNG